MEISDNNSNKRKKKLSSENVKIIKRKWKKEKSLKTFFLCFLLKTFLLIMTATGIWFVVMCAAIKTGFMIPANDIEQKIDIWSESAEKEQFFSFDKFPETEGYVLYEIQPNENDSEDINNENIVSNLKLVEKCNVSENEYKKTQSILESEQKNKYDSWSNTKYESVYLKTQVCVAVFHVRARFSGKWMSALFPNAEIAIGVFLILLLILSIILSIIQTAENMKKEVIKMQKAAVEIDNQNLDFEIQWTKIKELNGVLYALEKLQTNLAESLKNQWKLEQDKKKQMSALAHDIKTPLTVIQGNSELLLEDYECPKYSINCEGLKNGELLEDNQSDSYEINKYYIQSIYNNAKQIQNYVNQIISISKDQKINISMKKLCLKELLEEIVEEAESIARFKNITIQNGFDSSMPLDILGDRELLKRALGNIIANAVYYTPDNGMVRIQAEPIKKGDIISVQMPSASPEKSNKYVRITITDSGKGFSREALMHAKEQFYQEDSSRTRKDHFGMGLYIANEIVTAADGWIELSNGKNGGGKVDVCVKGCENL